MARTDEIVHRLRHAAGLADSASNQGFSNERVLNALWRRSHASQQKDCDIALP
jgi:hypothetical protein